MRLLADENITPRIVRALRDAEHDVRWVREGSRGLADTAVAALAVAELRVLVTCDKDFGYLLFRGGVQSRGVILLRRPRTFDPVPAILTALARYGSRLRHGFLVLSPSGGRFRPILGTRIPRSR